MTPGTVIQLSPEIGLPLDVATEALAILGTRGSGKSYTGAVLAESLWDAHVQFCILDPTGVYWGLRSNKAGTGNGIAIVILGGPHGDAPLEPTAGALIADVLVDTGQSLVLDLSDFPSKAAQTRFATDLAERLYRRKARARSPLHIILDEAEEFIPQDVRGDGARMVGAWETIVALGRSRGLGATLMSRRVQAVNKKVLDLIETMIAMRTSAPLARKRIEGWIEAKEIEDEAGVVSTLKELPTGTAWIWSPLRGSLAETAIRRIRTFDSYRTPKPGEAPQEARRLAPIDVDALGEKIAATVEQAKENDPAALRQRLRAAEQEIAKMKREPPKLEASRVEVEVPVPYEVRVPYVPEAAKTAVDAARIALEQAQRELDDYQPAPPPRPEIRKPTPGPSRPAGRSHLEQMVPVPPPLAVNGDVKLKAGARRMLAMLGRLHPTPLTKIQLGTLADISPNSGTFSDYKNALRASGLVAEEHGLLALTDAGVASLNGQIGGGAPNPHELKAMWETKFKAGARRMLDVLFDAYPDTLTRDELAERAEITRTSGTFSDYLNALKRNHVAVETGGRVTVGDALFIGA